MHAPIHRARPGCEQACEECHLACAVFAALRDDLWREVERLHRERALYPGRVSARDLEAATAQLAGAEQGFARARPRSNLPERFEASPGTSLPGRPH